jgi:general secretion pathway protein L
MRDRCFLRLGSEFPDHVEWLCLSAAGTPVDGEDTAIPVTGEALPEHGDLSPQRHVSRGNLADAARAAAGRQLIVLVPGTMVTLTEAVVPSRQRQQIISAVPYALEEYLASDIEALHFALGPRSDSGVVPVAVVARSLMEHWLGDLRAAGLEPDSMIPDMLALPLQDDAWVALQDQSWLWLRRGAYSGAVIDAGEASQWLQLMIEEQADEQMPARIHRIDCRDDGDAVELQGVAIDSETSDETPLMVMAQAYTGDNVINLIQGEYSPREQLGRLLRPWRSAAILLLIVMVVGFAQLLLQYFSLSSASERLAADIEQVYRDTFPEARKVVDARAQMQQKLAELGAGAAGAEGFLPLLASIAEALHKQPELDLRHASYQGGRLSLSLRIKDLQLLEQLKQRLMQGDGIAVEIQSAASRDAFVEARLLVWREAT